MKPVVTSHVVFGLALAGSLVGCATSSATPAAGSTTLPPELSTGSTPEERAWVEALNRAQSETPVTQDGLALGPIYNAASGRECRTLMTQGAGSHLACMNGDRWYLVPDVFPSGIERTVP